MYFDRANNYWVAAVSLGYKAGKRSAGRAGTCYLCRAWLS
jgi:hypothetical protein